MDSALAQLLWSKNWHLVCHRNELPKEGDFVRFRVLEHEVVVFNDGSDVVAFDNRCPHRGARIYVEETGSRPAICSYHGWTFRRGMVHIPGRDLFSSVCDLSAAKLNRWKSEWVGDFLFVSPDPDLDVGSQLGNKIQSILEDVSFGVTGRHDWNAYQFKCDWRIAVENALEPYHIGMVHPTTLGLLSLEDGVNEFHGRNSIWYAPVGSQSFARKLDRVSALFQLDFQYKGYMSIYIYPFTMLSSTYGCSYSLQSFFPSSARDETHFYSRLLAMSLRPGKSPEIVSSFLDSTAATNRQVFDEDHRVCKLVPTSSWSPKPPAYCAANEAKLLHFRQSCLDVLNQQGLN